MSVWSSYFCSSDRRTRGPRRPERRSRTRLGGDGRRRMIDDLLVRMGFPRVEEAQIAEIGIAAMIAGLALIAGWVARRRLGPRVADWLHGRDIQAQSPLTAHVPALLGWATALLLAAVGWGAWPGDPYAGLLLGTVGGGRGACGEKGC